MYFKKIVLVGVNSQYIHSNLAIRYLNKICKINGIDTIMREFTINQRFENVFREIYELKPDLVCFSVYIWNIEFINKIIKLLKIIDKNIIILCGGPEVSFSSKEFLLNSPVDFIIEGEGEETFLDFLNLYPKKDELLEIRGLYSKFQEKIYYLGKRDPLNIDNIPFPYDDEEDLKNKILYYESSRGCPFKCSYCLSSISREVRFRNIEKAKKELKYFTDKKVKLIKFVDRTFNCNQAYSYSIWEYLINDYYRENHETSFHFEISADLFSERELVLLKRAPKGLFQFEIGVQTTNCDVIKTINRSMNLLKLKENVLFLRDNTNIKIHLDLIAGLPLENKASFINSFNEIYHLKPNELQLGFLKIIKGSPMSFQTEKWGMKVSPFPPYEILSNDFISYDDILELKLVEEVLDRYHNSSRFNLTLKFFELKFKTAYDFYLSLASFLKGIGGFERSISNEENYRVLYMFAKLKFPEDSEIVKDLIRFEYLYFNNKKVDRLFDSDLNLNKDVDKVRKSIGNNYFVSKFSMDILAFKERGELIKGNFILCFQKNNSQNVTQINVNQGKKL